MKKEGINTPPNINVIIDQLHGVIDHIVEYDPKVCENLNITGFQTIKWSKYRESGPQVGMPSLQIYAGVSSFETISPAFKSGQSWRLKIFPLVLLWFSG